MRSARLAKNMKMKYNVINTNFLFSSMKNFSFAEQRLIGYEQVQRENLSVASEKAEVDPRDRSVEINDARAKLQRQIKELESRTGKMGPDLANKWQNYVGNRRGEIETAIKKSNDGTGTQQAALDAIERCSKGLKPVLEYKFEDALRQAPYTIEMSREGVRVTVPNTGGKYKPYLRTDRGFSQNGTLDASGRYEWKIPGPLATDAVLVGSYNDAGVATETQIDARKSTPTDIAKGPMISIDSTISEAKPKLKETAPEKKRMEEVKQAVPLSPGEQVNADLSDDERKVMKRWDLGPLQSTTDGEKLVSSYERAGLRLDQLQKQFSDLKLGGVAPVREGEKTEDQKAMEAVQARYAAFRQKRANVETAYQAKDNASRYVNQALPETKAAFDQAASVYTERRAELQDEPGKIIAEIQRVSEQFANTVQSTSEGNNVAKKIEAALKLPAAEKVDALVNGLELPDEKLILDLKQILNACDDEVKTDVQQPDLSELHPDMDFGGKLIVYDAAVYNLREKGGSFTKLDPMVAKAERVASQLQKTERPEEIVAQTLKFARRQMYLEALKKLVKELKTARQSREDLSVGTLDKRMEQSMTDAEKYRFFQVKNMGESEMQFLGQRRGDQTKIEEIQKLIDKQKKEEKKS